MTEPTGEIPGQKPKETPRGPGGGGPSDPRPSGRTTQEPSTLTSLMEGLTPEHREEVTRFMEAMQQIEETLAADADLVARITGKKKEDEASAKRDDSPDQELERDMIVVLAKLKQKSLNKWTDQQLSREYQKWKEERPGISAKHEQERKAIKNILNDEINARVKKAKDAFADSQLLWNQLHEGAGLSEQPVHVIEFDINKLNQDEAAMQAYVRRKAAEYKVWAAEQEAAERARVAQQRAEQRRQPKRASHAGTEAPEGEPGVRSGSLASIRAKTKVEAHKLLNNKELRDKAKKDKELEDARYLEERGAHVKSTFEEGADSSDGEDQFDYAGGRSRYVDGKRSGQAVPGAAKGNESRIDMGEESMLPPGDWDDYYDQRDELVKVNKKTGMLASSWKAYGWDDDSREAFATSLVEVQGMSPDQAYKVLAALVLHGKTADDVAEYLIARPGPDNRDYNRLEELLHKEGRLVIDDDDVMDIIYGTEKTDRINILTQGQPDYLEDLAYQIMYADRRTNTIFHRRNAYALLTNKVQRHQEKDADGKTITRFTFAAEAHADAIFAWFIASAMEEHGNATTKGLDFEQVVNVAKSGISAPLSIYTMMSGRYGSMLSSRYTGQQHAWIADQLEAIANFLSETRNSAIEIQAAMGDKKQLEQTRGAQLIFNNMVRNVGGVSLTEMLLKLSELGNRKEGGDRKLGAAMLTRYIALSNLPDMNGLARVLDFGGNQKEGEEAKDIRFQKMFSLTAFRKARNDALAGRRAGGKTDIPPVGEEDRWLDLSQESIFKRGLAINGIKLKDIFNEDGTPKLGTPDQNYKFMQFVNFYTHVTPNERLGGLIRGIIGDRVDEIHGIRGKREGMTIPGISDFMDMVSHGLTYRFGIYHVLDVGLSGRSEEGKVNARYLNERSKKDAHAANLYQLGFMPQQMLLPEAFIVSTTTIDPETGKPVNIQNAFIAAYEERMKLDRKLTKAVDAWWESKDPAIKAQRDKLVAEKMEKILKHRQKKPRESEVEYQKRLKRDFGDTSIKELAEKDVKLDYRDELLKTGDFAVGKKAYDQAASGLAFNEAVERNYYQDYWQKGWHMDERYTGAKQLSLEKYIHIDAYGGATVKMDEFTNDCAKFFNQMRKFLTGTKYSLGTLVPLWNEEEKKMEMIPLGEAVLGTQVLNKLLKDPKFWKYNTEGILEVDWEKLEGKDTHIEKWMEIGFITGQLLQYSERAEWNMNPRYSYQVKAAIVQAIKHLPGSFHVNPNDARAGEADEYFEKIMLDWFREASGTKNMFWTEALANLFGGAPGKKDGIWAGIAAMFAQMGKAIAIR